MTRDEPTLREDRCCYISAYGYQCNNKPKDGLPFCRRHSPDQAAKRKRRQSTIKQQAQEIGRLRKALEDFTDTFEGDFVLDDGTIVDHPEAQWSPLVDLYRKSKAALQPDRASRLERSEERETNP